MASKLARTDQVVADHRFLLLGKTGSGKSTTGNTILGEDLFDSEFSFESVTDSCTFKYAKRNGKVIEIMDSPGLFDTKKKHEEISGIVMQAVACMHPGPDAVLYVVKLGRYTEEEFGVYNRLKALLDDNVTHHMILLFTHGDSLKGKSLESMLDKVPKQLQQVFMECGRRYVVFDNMAPNKEEQVNTLLEEIAKMKAANGNQPYKCPKYSELGDRMEAEIERRMAVVEKKEAESKKYVQQLSSQLEMVQKTADEEKAAFQKKEKEREAQLKAQEEKMKKEMEIRKQQELSTAELERQLSDLRKKKEPKKKALEVEQDAEPNKQELIAKLQKKIEKEKQTLEEMRRNKQEEQRSEVQRLKEKIASKDASKGGSSCAIL